jgi:hypothetical protein
MAFQGGPLSTLGITPTYILNTISTVSRSNQNQLYQGSGQSFVSQPGQSLSGNLTKSVINIALNSKLGGNITNQSGVPLTTGNNVLASNITSLISSNLSFGANKNISQTLSSAGAFGPLLSQLGGIGGGGGGGSTGGFLSSLFGGRSDSAAGQAQPWGQKAFPGAGSEPPADYAGGSPYTLGPNGSDVVFSLQPANKGPQQSGLDQSINDSAVKTTMAAKHFTNPSFKAPNTTADALKFAAMNDNVTTRVGGGGGVLQGIPLGGNEQFSDVLVWRDGTPGPAYPRETPLF